MMFESVNFIYELSEKFQLGNRLTELGIIMFHTFIAKSSIMTFNMKVVAGVALYLAWKLDSPKSSTPFIDQVWLKRNPKNPESIREFVKKEFFQIELKILIELDFDLDIQVPRTYLIHFDYRYKPVAWKLFWSKFSETDDPQTSFDQVWAFFLELTSKLLNDTFFSPLCLYYHPAVIVAACLVFVQTFTLSDQPELSEALLANDWHTYLHEDLNFGTVTEWAAEIDQLFGKI